MIPCAILIRNGRPLGVFKTWKQARAFAIRAWPYGLGFEVLIFGFLRKKQIKLHLS